ncbi:hypothetical protein HPP92_001884 [Vanilla planifolia]|uniref:Uncharacterized protein n=1 Tax=Vanilla planifolia TaxID=51239 RepID=A0A835SDP5_VANPL|nr:hypothetical protein HPP92_001884 [Vanilla planifolia]
MLANSSSPYSSSSSGVRPHLRLSVQLIHRAALSPTILPNHRPPLCPHAQHCPQPPLGRIPLPPSTPPSPPPCRTLHAILHRHATGVRPRRDGHWQRSHVVSLHPCADCFGRDVHCLPPDRLIHLRDPPPAIRSPANCSNPTRAAGRKIVPTNTATVTVLSPLASSPLRPLPSTPPRGSRCPSHTWRSDAATTTAGVSMRDVRPGRPRRAEHPRLPIGPLAGGRFSYCSLHSGQHID